MQGCDASILLNATDSNNPAEKDAIPNSFLRGYGVIDTIKAKLEKACPSTVSCADVLALIARDVVSLVRLLIIAPRTVSYVNHPSSLADSECLQAKGPYWEVPTGRRDGRVSIMSEALNMLPGFTANIASLKSQFAAQGLSVKDLVVLSGLIYAYTHICLYVICRYLQRKSW